MPLGRSSALVVELRCLHIGLDQSRACTVSEAAVEKPDPIYLVIIISIMIFFFYTNDLY